MKLPPSLPASAPLPERLAEIEALQDRVLAELDELNRRIEQVVAQQGGPVPRRGASPNPLPAAA